MRITIACFIAALAATGCSKEKKPTTPTAQAADTPAATAESAGPAVEASDRAVADPGALGAAIYFEFDSASLDDESREVLVNNVEWLKENPARSILIEGHTDETGTPEYNVALGEQRARAAKEFMVRMGIDPARIDILSYGEERPAGDEDAKNRRSMFIATKQ
jgi:peptidoglycan-associated lipoprotein